MTRLAVLPKAEVDTERRWTSPVELNAYDRCPTLSQNEKQTLQALAKSHCRWGDGGSKGASQIQDSLRRLLQPVKDALAVMPGRHSDKDTAAAALLRACQRERRAYWGWSSAVWQRILGHTQAEFFRENGSLVRSRPFLTSRFSCIILLPSQSRRSQRDANKGHSRMSVPHMPTA